MSWLWCGGAVQSVSGLDLHIERFDFKVQLEFVLTCHSRSLPEHRLCWRCRGSNTQWERLVLASSWPISGTDVSRNHQEIERLFYALCRTSRLPAQVAIVKWLTSGWSRGLVSRFHLLLSAWLLLILQAWMLSSQCLQISCWGSVGCSEDCGRYPRFRWFLHSRGRKTEQMHHACFRDKQRDRE